MILHSEDKSKFISLIVLVTITTGLILWQWTNFSTWQKIEPLVKNEAWDQTVENTEDAFQEIRNSFGLARYHLDNLQIEMDKDQKRTQLLEATKKYVSDNKTIEE
ncbi:hypothetical protein HOD19_03760 [bacterium]|jgi:hypothetical protein|nr:hypothetical protein [bacterium]MBT4648929.1 hypothetical protein [bacterium]